jgi:FkbM family methyltransferase
MKRFPWKLTIALLIAAGLAGLGWPYLLAVGARGWMVVSGRKTECGARETLLSARVAMQQETTAGQIRASMRQLKRDADGLELWSTAHGEMWIPAGAGRAISYDLAEQARSIYSYGGAGVRPGDVVLDVGANVGLYTREALRAGAAKVIAIEPVPAVVECLRRNLSAEIAAGRVIVVDKGAWDKDDFLEMNVYPGNMAASTFAGERPGEQQVKVRLPLTTLDRMAAELKLERVDFIKMDIEGAERNAVRGAAAIIRRDKPRMALCVYHKGDDPVVIPREVATIRADYRHNCGICLYEWRGVSPEVFFFE